MEYWTTKETALKWGITANRITILCKKGRINGAIQIGTQWLIPRGSKKPIDARTLKVKENEKVDSFRFPLFVNFSENSYMPQLSLEEKKLRQAEIDLLACDFVQAKKTFSELIAKTKNIYIRVTSLIFSCIISAYYENGKEFNDYFTNFNFALMQDFPHKKEMELFNPYLHAFFTDYKTASKQLEIDPEYPYSFDCLHIIGVLSFSHLSNTNTKDNQIANLDVYELECKQAEKDGYIYETLEMHFMLFMCYHLTINKTYMFYHLRKGLELVKEYNMIFIAACYADFYPKEFANVLSKFPKDFSDKILHNAKLIRESFARFKTSNDCTNIYKDLSQNDYQYVFYAMMNYSNAQIAGILNKSEKTVANRYKEIYEKLAITSRKELVALYNSTVNFKHK